MATESKVAAEDPKIDLFEDDDEFEEFEINEGNSLFFLSVSRSIKFAFLCFCFLGFIRCSLLVLFHWDGDELSSCSLGCGFSLKTLE